MKKVRRKLTVKGLTLLEIIVSLGILTLSTLSVLGLSVYSAKVGRQSEARGAALAVARTTMDQILSVSQSNRVPVSDKAISIPASIASSIPGDNVSAKYSIRPVPGSKSLQQLEVVISWRNATGNSSATLTSVACSKIIASTTNMDWTLDPWNPHPIEQYFYNPPPPPPPPTTTGGGSSSGSSSSSSGSSTGGSSTGGSSSGGSSGGSSSSSSGSSGGGSSTGSSSGSTGGSTGTSDPPYKGFTPPGGNKWK